MPRNSSGTYTLPSGNPVSSGTLIEASWANTTLSDLASAMTNSLSRGGEGGMTAALRLFDGTVSSPGLAFTSETSTGLYRAGAGDMRLAVTGSQVVQFLTTGVAVTGTLGASGNFAINTNKFTVAASSGNTVVAGTLGVTGDFAINTNKFTVTASSGNAAIAGTLSVTGSVTSAGASNSGNLTFTGTSNRITGDFSNATQANKVAFQTSTTNGATVVATIPNGTSIISQLRSYNGTDPDNAAWIGIVANGLSQAQLTSGITGTGTYLPMTFYTGGGEKMRIDTSGNVGIGVTPSGVYKLQVNGQINGTSVSIIGANSGAIYVQDSNTTFNPQIQFIGTNRTFQLGTGNSASGFNNQFFIYDGTAAATRMLIDSSGNVGIGTSSPSYKLDTQTSGAAVFNYQTSATNGGYGVWNAGSTITYIGSLKAILATGSASDFAIVGTGANNLVLGTNSAERMRIDSSGNLLVGTITQRGVAGITLTPNTSNGAGEIAFNRNSTTSTSYVVGFQNAGSTVGYIAYSNSTVTYNTGSDARLKNNVAPAPASGSIVDAINIVQHDWLSGGHADFSVIAQDLHTVYPQAVTPGDDGEVITQTWGVDYSKLVPLLVKEIQSLRARVAAIETI